MPKMPSLFEPDLKRQWAKCHLDSLKAEVDRFGENHPYRVFGEEDLQASEYLVKTIHPDLTYALPAVLRLGDFLNCLRVSLDYLAYQMVFANGRKATRETAFPIFGEDTIDTQLKITKATFGIAEPAISIVKSLQPYHAGEHFKSNHLWRLVTLCNIDKHRHISGFSPRPEWQFVLKPNTSIAGRNMRVEQVENCTIVHLPLEAKDYVEFNPEGKTELRFSVDLEGIDVGYKDLLEMHDFVAYTVFPLFTGFFPNPEIPGETIQCPIG